MKNKLTLQQLQLLTLENQELTKNSPFEADMYR
ncbi:hypothetical protein SRABI04_03737 [Chryseobacterium sp. Bi04]|nr:hypothetical protein SRABI04_03737 [Chryseobacterium sp. Bi04]